MNQIYIPEGIRKEHMRSTNSINVMYHLTDALPFFPEADFRNNQQEFGAGFYVTNKENIRKWDYGLGGRKYVVELTLDGVKMIHEKDFPSNRDMARFLKSKGFGSRDLELFKPSGEFFNRNPIDIATKRAWMDYKGLNAIVPFKDKNEGEQMILTDIKTVKAFRQFHIINFINKD